MKNETFIDNYISEYVKTVSELPVRKVTDLIVLYKRALKEERQIFVFGNGGSAANSSHFITDLNKGASDKSSKKFKAVSLNDNFAWITALGNDYSYDEIFSRQLMNFARPGDFVMVMSVSGSSPNLVKAVEWARDNEVFTVALLGGKEGKLAEISDFVLKVDDTHYGRVEDAHMSICHMICYAFMEGLEN